MCWMNDDKVREFCETCPDYHFDRGGYNWPPEDVCEQGEEDPSLCSHHKEWERQLEEDEED